jgi:hypothetical protein
MNLRKNSGSSAHYVYADHYPLGFDSVDKPLSSNQNALEFGERLEAVRLDPARVLHAHAPRAGVETAVAHGDNRVRRRGGRLFLAVEEGVAGRRGRLLEIDADAFTSSMSVTGTPSAPMNSMMATVAATKRATDR